MATKHTPGPWKANNCAVMGLITPKGFNAPLAICQCVHPQKVDMSVARANAILIAAAPEILEALEKCAAYLLSIKGPTVGGEGAVAHDCRIAAEAAIRKAKGIAGD